MNNPSFNDDALDALLAQARATRVDTSRAEYAFETRLLARLHEAKPSLWTKVTWRMIPGFAVAVMALAFWTVQVTEEATDAQALSNVDNPEALQLWN